jgi:hypothetical protein
MKKIIILLSLVTLLSSCGKNAHPDASSVSKSDPFLDHLSQEEATLIEELRNTGVMTQKELTRKLISFYSFDQKTLRKLDVSLNVQCIHASGLCYITDKN